MSRRREAQELQRALALSTQDATRFTLLSPHQPSSSGSGSGFAGGSATQSSREMELREATVATIASEMGGAAAPQIGVGMHGATVRRGEVMGPPPSSLNRPSGSSGSSGRKGRISDPIISQGTSQAASVNTFSAINSFPPSHAAASVIVPASSSAKHSSSNNKSAASSSSHRPIFSPTQVSNVPSRVASASTPVGTSTQRRDSKTYGRRSKSPDRSHPAGPCRFPLSPDYHHDQHHALHQEAGPDDEPEEPLEFPEIRTPASKHSRVEIVLKPRDSTNPPSVSKVSPLAAARRLPSPDPLDGLASKSPVKSYPPSSMSNAGTEDGSGRRSSRVQQKKEDEEKAKALRRAKRAAEKEAKARLAELEKETMPVVARDVIVLDDDGEIERPAQRIEKLRSDSKRTDVAEPKKRNKLADDQDEDDWDPKRKKKDKRKEKDKASSKSLNAKELSIEPQVVEAQDIPSSIVTANFTAAKPMKKAMEVKANAKSQAQIDVEEKEQTAAAPQLLTADMPEPQLTHSATTDSQPKEVTVTPVSSELEKENTSMASTTQSTDKTETPTPGIGSRKRPLDHADTNRPNPTPLHRPSPGPLDSRGIPQAPGGIKWKTSRNDLGSVLAKFQPVRAAGMSKRLRIVPLHMTIGTPVKALPPVPKKPSKKKDESDEEEEEEEQVDEHGHPLKKIKPGSKEWLMMED